MKINIKDIKFKDFIYTFNSSFIVTRVIGDYYCAIVNSIDMFKIILKEEYSPKNILYTLDRINDNLTIRIRKEGFVYISDNINEVKKILMLQ
jgi:hypothetical protein